MFYKISGMTKGSWIILIFSLYPGYRDRNDQGHRPYDRSTVRFVNDTVSPY